MSCSVAERSADERSRVAFIVHSFNRRTNVDKLASSLKRLGKYELIVCDDGSIDGSREAWRAHLDGQNDHLLLSNDLHEIRILDRALDFSCAEIACIVQDDDTIPSDAYWISKVVQAFDCHPDLAIVGGFMGFHGFDTNPGNVHRIWGGDMPFQFVEHVNIGPYFIRKSCYKALGGWDYSFSKVGEPGICFDNELCLRAWGKGYKVGYLFVPFKGQPGQYVREGGTILFSADLRRSNQLRNERRILEIYGQNAKRISQLVKNANNELTETDNKSVLS